VDPWGSPLNPEEKDISVKAKYDDVPAIERMTLVEIELADLGGNSEEPLFTRYPIVAWRAYLDGNAPIPVAVGVNDEADLSHHNLRENPFFVELPGGGFRHSGYMGRLYESLEECVTAVVAARQSWLSARINLDVA
jgi:hypothetical protein